MQPVPAAGEIIEVSLGEPGDAELRDQSLERRAVEDVENDIAALVMPADLVHRTGIETAPAIDQCGPVALDAAALRPYGEVVDQAGAPIDHGAEHVEHQRPDPGQIGHRRNSTSRNASVEVEFLQLPVLGADVAHRAG